MTGYCIPYLITLGILYTIHEKFGRRKNLPSETSHLKPGILKHWET